MTPRERAQAGRADASAPGPGRTGPGDPLPGGRQHPSPQEYQARAGAGLEENIRHGMSPELAGASYEADMHAESYAERWHDWAEAQWQAAADAQEAGSVFEVGVDDLASGPEPEAW